MAKWQEEAAQSLRGLRGSRSSGVGSDGQTWRTRWADKGGGERGDGQWPGMSCAQGGGPGLPT
jgi:hypothetical protein